MKKTSVNLIPDVVNTTPDYYCTWQTQSYITNGGPAPEQRKVICEKSIFNTEKPYGWAYFYEKARKDLIFVMDDSWDVPLDNNTDYYGSLILSEEKFPSFCKPNQNSLKNLSEKIKSLCWKGLGGWICAQESLPYLKNQTVEEYWIERLKVANEAGMLYWKVDWGDKALSGKFRKMLTDLAKIYAPNLIVEHGVTKEALPFSEVYRTYDVPEIMSIPMTLQKIVDCSIYLTEPQKQVGILNCEDEVYMAAAGGYAMGVMRHHYVGDFPNGEKDAVFPTFHRNIKSKMYEVLRATRYHRIAPAFSGGDFKFSDTVLCDEWEFKDKYSEMEKWWFDYPLARDSIKNGVLTKSAPAVISRNTELPLVMSNTDGLVPFCLASLNPNGVYSVATFGRTLNRQYIFPKCDVTITALNSNIIGIFGKYKTLTVISNADFSKVVMQDIAEDYSYDITEYVTKQNGKFVISGDIINKVSSVSQPKNDTSDPGVIIKLI